jgi:hypothetical protein
MHRFIPLAMTLGPTLLACAQPVAKPAATAELRHGIPVAYRLLRAGDGDGILLAGHTLIDPRNGARVNATAAHTSAGQRLDLEARSRDDGSIVVQVDYDESTDQGAKINWRPSLRIAPGATARAEVSGSGWERTLEISVE